MEKFKPVLPSYFPTSLVRHFPLSSALLCLQPYHMHPLPYHTPLPLTYLYLLTPPFLPISDSPLPFSVFQLPLSVCSLLLGSLALEVLLIFVHCKKRYIHV